MRKKLFIAFLLLCISSIIVGNYVIHVIGKSSNDLDTLIQLHQITVLREKMLDQITIVQRDLHLRQTRTPRDLAILVNHVETMTGTVEQCFGCHHNNETLVKLRNLRSSAEVYKQALSRVYTIRANEQRLRHEEDNAFIIGENLILDVNSMLRLTNLKLGIKTKSILDDVHDSRNILTFFTILLPVVVISVAVWFYFRFSKPITSLVKATNKLKTGDLDYRITGLKDEFGLVARYFNDMTHSLKEVMQTMVRAEEMVLMGEMASRLAHEIKNPITGIKLAAELIRDEAALEGEHKDLCQKTIEQIKNIENLMKGLLSFAKPPQPELEREDLNMIIETSLTTVEILVQKKSDTGSTSGNVEIIRDLGDDLPPVMTDASQVQQILLNLMLNAYDAMAKGGKLTVRSYLSPDGDMLTVEVSDTGDGIDPQLNEKIFLPFYSTKTRGTGLGLAIVSKLTELLGGKLAFTSERNVGTTFMISLPVEPPAA